MVITQRALRGQHALKNGKGILLFFFFLFFIVFANGNYTGCPQRATHVKKRVVYLFIFLLFILHRSRKW